ncbi:DUF6843 domain-containing protein [Mucilaginibacter boryungensis]|uniref:DUF6843 domain-containing protein n=1 Tax=Mucilaginibacter boryungensis TaxID=768480 RepID=A0ABR9XLH2_9SPHI|nr:hypothetical protein [Mucilaginibacter boryungensis]MBE9668241.1 hypothetical protein [Mucilaginibacter boryungensis]
MKKKLTIIIALVFFVSCKFAEKESYIFPEGFVGNAIIFTNLRNGDEEVYDHEGRRLYLISTSGLLLSRFKETYGVIDKKFFFGTKHKLNSEIKGVEPQDNIESLDKEKTYAFYGNDETITFPNSRDTLGVQVITICKPKDLTSFKDDLFVKRILGIR